ncbi:hypothetical protein [Flavobacterium gilvum]|uniref:Uncharacterized protein n=1 Tax=Flavobacterium gilvum TaxID=1492737 RepID=A0AAC9I8I4_9FLAO|nr:hypothetical protein [Flavobacterium gilvum]AOW11018.1 hypothetical protein EM308_16840 [Flavobacterium gilvum]KFC59187.1 hypothetical protein FEM08_20480 [Flavobacterium gilvum]
MDKNLIFSNIDSFSADQLFDFINQGIVTLDELRNTGDLDASKRQAITKLQKSREKEDDDAWNNCSKVRTEISYKEYIDNHPNGKYISEASELKSKLEKERIEREKEKEDILNSIIQNPNDFPVDTIRDYLSDGLLTADVLIQKGIPKEVINRLIKNDSAPNFTLGETPKSIPDGFTEVYFWGIRGSGKTTALSAVLSTAGKKGYSEIAQGPGYNYMLQLQNLFAENITILPTGTPTEKTQYLPFTLKKKKETNARSVSLVELSGEIFQCFLYKNASKKLPTIHHQETFDTLINYLKGNNRKMHFFFVDYDKKNNADQDGYTQANYLNAAATFFNNPEYNIFGKTTDAVYVVVTKSDLMPEDKNSKKDQISQYLNENYTSFVNSLGDKCKKHSINGKRILGTPFSIGTVYFEQICDFNPETAENIIDILMRRIAPTGESILDVFNK